MQMEYKTSRKLTQETIEYAAEMDPMERNGFIDLISDQYHIAKLHTVNILNERLKNLVICSPNLLKNLGIKLAMELIKEKPLSEQRLFQAIIVQALEDVMNISSFKKEAYWKEDAYKWFYSNSEDFQDVCWAADMDPELIRGEFFKLIKLKKIKFSKMQTHWLNYRELYRLYREADSKEERREIKKRIDQENLKRNE
jgi:hypothetical protein